MPVILLLATVIGAYLIGAIPFGYLIGRWIGGIDIRRHGSGNIGATNVGRVLGWHLFAVVFALDFAKGAGPVLAAGWLYQHGLDGSAPYGESDLAVWAGLMAILGHMWPVYLGFRGGKGVATSAGVITVLAPVPTLIALITWGVVVAVSRYVSAGSILAAVALCIAQIGYTWPRGFDQQNLSLTVFCVIAAGLIVVRHRANLVRLWRGTEPKFGQRHPPKGS